MNFLWRLLLAMLAGMLSGNMALADYRGASSNGTWKAFGGLPHGCDGVVRAIAVADSGIIYLGGNFRSCENVPANYLVAFDPESRAYSAVHGVNGQGLDGPVRALAVSGDDLYAGGDFDLADGMPAGRIARFDGSEWHALGAGISDEYLDRYWVNAIAVSDDDVYAAGRFHGAGGDEVNKIARFDGEDWHALGTGVGAIADWSEVFALEIKDGDLLAGGEFEFVGGVRSRCIARWDGSRWHSIGLRPVSPPTSCLVVALAARDNEVFAGGIFRLGSGSEGYTVARRDGAEWNAIDSPIFAGEPGLTLTLTFLGDDLFAGGVFEEASGSSASNIARWDGNSWHALGQESVQGVNMAVYALASLDGTLYAGGAFTRAGGFVANRIAGWNGSRWLPVGRGEGRGISGQINAFAVMGTDVYVGGQFDSAGGVAANNIARWDGYGWHPLGTGENNGVHGDYWEFITYPAHVRTIAVIDGDLYVAGTFRNAGDHIVNHIARWDGSEWHPMDSGVGQPGRNARVDSLVASGGDLYVGGHFSRVSGMNISALARWDGSEWHAIASNGLGGEVSALIMHGGDLYATGIFTNVEGVQVNNIARWDGADWHALGQGLEGSSSWARGLSLTVFGGDIYVGGTFDRAGGVEAGRIARWDGSSWHALDADFWYESGTAYVWTMLPVGDQLYVGGNFHEAGGNSVGGIAMWDGSGWHPLQAGSDPGTNGGVFALLAGTGKDCFGSTVNQVLAGGSFSQAGGIVSRNVALYSAARELDPEQIFCSRFE